MAAAWKADTHNRHRIRGNRKPLNPRGCGTYVGAGVATGQPSTKALCNDRGKEMSRLKIELKLSERAAEAWLEVLEQIAGDHSGPRSAFASVSCALREAGVRNTKSMIMRPTKALYMVDQWPDESPIDCEVEISR